MKKMLLPLLLCFFVFQLSAQKANVVKGDKAQKITQELTELYVLSEEQAAKVYKIQVRKYEQYAAIQNLESKDPTTYVTKLKAIHTGNEGSIKLLLNTEQLRAFQMNSMQMRKKRADKATALKIQGLTSEEIDKAIWSIE